MDWRRAKTILIIAFLFLDSFLAYQLWTSRGPAVEMAQQNVAVSSSLQDILKSRNITLAREAPQDMPEMNYLNVRYNDFRTIKAEEFPNQNIRLSGHTLESKFTQSLPIPRLMARGELNKLLTDYIPFLDEYKPDLLLTRKDQITYFQYWNSYPLFGAELVMQINDDRVIGYKQTHFEVVNNGSGKKVISSFTALQTLIENGIIPYGETVHQIDLGYYGHTYDADIQVIAPVWRVVHGENQVHYVNGITGVIEKITSMPKKE